MKSITLSIYNTEMSPQKNFVVEDVETYLSRLITKTYETENFQVPKISLNMTIKINVSQDNVFKQIGNYVRMLCDSRKYYFFIIGAEWKSSNTVELRLYMDTLNTFYDLFKLHFSEKTLITRQHADRWLPNQKLGSLLMPKVNEISEGLEGLPLYKRDDVILGQQSRDERLNQPWFLVYQTPETPTSSSPIEIYLYPKKPVPMVAAEALIVTSNSFEEDIHYYFMEKDGNGQLSISNEDGSNIFRIGDNYELSGTIYKIIGFALFRENNEAASAALIQSPADSSIKAVRTNHGTSLKIRNAHLERKGGNVVLKDTGAIYSLPVFWESESNTYLTSKTIESVDRTSSRLIKIIEYPYCPLNITWDVHGNIQNINAGIYLDYDTLTFIVDNKAEFLRTNIEDIALPVYVPFEPTNHAEKNMVRYVSDPKLYHSSFSLFKFVYDSYSLPIAMERAHYSKPTAKFTLEMKASNSIQSNLAFHLATNDIDYTDNADYSLYLISTRNNEAAIFSNAYIDYLRNGYNFDRKNQSRAAALTWTTTALSLVGSAVSFALSPFTGGVSAIAGVGLLTSSVASIGNAISSTAQNESNIQKTLEQTKSQATNVSGVDDLDLLKYYGQNKVHFMKYTVSENMKKKLNDLFYYCGYAYQNYGKPNLNSRLWFNFVQCDPVFERNHIYNEYLDDISSHFKLGVTIFHHDENGNYDLKQTKENWEVSLL